MINLEIYNEFSSELKDKWLAIEKGFLKNPFNSFYWIIHWYKSVGIKSLKLNPQIVLIYNDNKLSYILPLCIIRRNGVSILEWIGDIHSDYSSPLIISNFIDNHTTFNKVWTKILLKLGKFDLINLKRQPLQIDINITNPFVIYLNNKVHDISFQLNINNSWEEFSKEKRKKKILLDSNRQRRRIEKKGIINFITPDSRIKKSEIITKMIEFKRYRYKLMKVRDLLSSKHNRDFYLGLDDALDGGILKLHVSALLINDIIVAAHLGTILNDKFYYLMPSNDFNEWQKYSVGRLLLEELLKISFNEKFNVFDFSIGDESYKKNWCNQKTELYQHLMPMNLKGFIYKLSLHIKLKLIKSNFWTKIKFLRK
jgi:CelD/BcsL family acetyltransferase involved in cellulose biosynthesis